MIDRRWTRRLAAPLLLVALTAVAFTACGDDDDDATEGPVITGATAMFTRADLGAVHLTITGGDEDDELVSASTGIAGAVEVHETVTEGAGSTMQEVEGVEIPAGETVVFEPGSYHFMLMDVTEPLAEGDTFSLELTFKEAGAITVDVTVDTVLSGGDSNDDPSGDDHGDDHEGDEH